jgi:hypothetical protein
MLHAQGVFVRPSELVSRASFANQLPTLLVGGPIPLRLFIVAYRVPAAVREPYRRAFFKTAHWHQMWRKCSAPVIVRICPQPFLVVVRTVSEN